MKHKMMKGTAVTLAFAGAFLLGGIKADAAELASSVRAGVAVTMDMTTDEAVLAAAVAPSVVEGYTLLGVVDAGSGYVNIREEMSTESEIVGKIRKNAVCEVVTIENEWCEIKSGEIHGYISREFLLVGAAANERAEELLEAGVELKNAVTLMEYRYGEGVTDIQLEICEYARQFVGNPYRWGGTSLTKGADCSGFTLAVFKNFGISLPHSSGAQANCGERIEVSEVQPGDLVFYGGKNIHHVALYIGNGQVVHAQSSNTGIVISSMYYNTPTRAARILEY